MLTVKLSPFTAGSLCMIDGALVHAAYKTNAATLVVISVSMHSCMCALLFGMCMPPDPSLHQLRAHVTLVLAFDRKVV